MKGKGREGREGTSQEKSWLRAWKVHIYVTFIQQYVNIITVFCVCDEGKMSIMLHKMHKKGTYSVPASVPPGCGTNRLKNRTSRRKRDGLQP